MAAKKYKLYKRPAKHSLCACVVIIIIYNYIPPRIWEVEIILSLLCIWFCINYEHLHCVNLLPDAALLVLMPRSVDRISASCMSVVLIVIVISHS